MLGLKIAVGLLMLFFILGAEVVLVFLLVRLRAAAKPFVRSAIDSFMGRNDRRRRLDTAFDKAYEYASNPLTLYTIIGMVCVDVYAAYVAIHTKSPEAWIAAQVTIIVAAVASLACISVSGKNLLSVYFSSNWAKTVWATLAGAMFWLGTIHTKADLNWNYGAASNQMSATVQAGAVLRGIGELSVLFFIPILLLEIALFLAFGDTRRKDDKIYQRRRRRFIIVVFPAYLLAYMGFKCGLNVASNVPIFEAFETDMAWTTDAYPTRACTGADLGKDKRVVFTNAASSQAVIFGEPVASDQRVVKWQSRDVLRSRMQFVHVADCPKEAKN